ncbi:MAG: winged helix-turn-helix domain-containing protein [Proteobacteria bacterium]|nr:winged helix-turn-helix domain-containing protein [Pseudomonadota bacterium]MDE3209078.1 winged helix-turn-helix transcriptional regulator [Pseudomonadota bacterium]
MDTDAALLAFASLAHATRLSIVRRLIQAGPEGVTAGNLSQELNLMASALSFHLNDLVECQLIKARHAGRRIYYTAHYATMEALIRFLSENCCNGQGCSLIAPLHPPDTPAMQKQTRT